ncbi:alpha/beta hydrolase [Massilia sp. Dwa41.01b]|uniref:alpha/beta fold hydrolase n=1 Tax=unclassified Massilia TaxID=2609279 RepID=UPI0016034F79|nr:MULTISPECIES: alpha/beta hydrolase [unclassified Massilia]QNA88946.1 alpha/beta hydrolase [Massilia sp. Dwa41.01b]QNA99834.1 alpha/beta hydrolase [Massilia sp. Se16.2.3]
MTKPLLHFCHGNSFPSGTYRQLLDALGAHYEVRSTDMVGHDPRFPVGDGWSGLVDELISELEGYGRPVILVGHSLGGMLSTMAAERRPELARCVVMLDSPVVAGWRALAWRLIKLLGKGSRFSPARFSERRRNVWPDRETAYRHFMSKDIFAAWAPGVLDDYLDVGLKPHPNGVQLRFDRAVETTIYNSLPHHMGEVIRRDFPVPVGFIGATNSEELRQAGLASTRKLVGENFVMTEGGHLYPMEDPARAAQLTHAMIQRLLGSTVNSGETLTEGQV